MALQCKIRVATCVHFKPCSCRSTTVIESLDCDGRGSTQRMYGVPLSSYCSWIRFLLTNDAIPNLCGPFNERKWKHTFDWAEGGGPIPFRFRAFQTPQRPLGAQRIGLGSKSFAVHSKVKTMGRIYQPNQRWPRSTRNFELNKFWYGLKGKNTERVEF